MTKSHKRKLKNKRKKLSKQQPEKTPTRTETHFEKKKIIPFMWKIFGGFGLILGVVVTLYPKPQVDPAEYLDQKNPLKTLYKITNDGFLPLHEVKILCGINEVRGPGNTRIIGAGRYESRLFNPSHVANVLEYGESDTAFCALGSLIIPYNIEYADLAIIVEFSPPFIPFWRMNKTFPFTTEKNIKGDILLVHKPLNKNK